MTLHPIQRTFSKGSIMNTVYLYSFLVFSHSRHSPNLEQCFHSCLKPLHPYLIHFVVLCIDKCYIDWKAFAGLLPDVAGSADHDYICEPVGEERGTQAWTILLWGMFLNTSGECLFDEYLLPNLCESQVFPLMRLIKPSPQQVAFVRCS